MLLTLAPLALSLVLPQSNPEEAAKAVLRDFHQAAAEGNLARYLGHLAPDVLLLGSGPGQRYDYATYAETMQPYFTGQPMRASRPVDQEVHLLPGGRMAWFRERLDYPGIGAFRGTGVLRRTPADWQIVQYDMTFLIPNDLVPDFAREMEAAADPDATPAPQGFPKGLDRNSEEPVEAVKALLVALHETASRGDATAHFDCLDSSGVMLMTDASERFPMDEFQEWIGGWFAQGVRVLSYPVRQSVRFNAERTIAWFDEDLRSSRWGAMRSSGVALRRPDGWKIAYYSLGFPVPDSRIAALAARVKQAGARAVRY